jgi:LuxR family maltose regulon positive regulatory protein
VLGEVLALAEPGGFVRIFLDQGEAMWSLLRELVEKQSRDQEHPQSDYAGRLLLAFQQPMTVPKPANMQQKTEVIEPEVQPARNRLAEPLSNRELEVLRLLRTELSGPEIAGELVISPNTFRTHTKNIFSKLGVNNRRAAVRRAEELDLF